MGNHPQGEGSSYRKAEWGRGELGKLVGEDRLLGEGLEQMMTNKEAFWPDPQIAKQAVCEGKEGPFARFGKDLSSVLVEVKRKATSTIEKITKKFNIKGLIFLTAIYRRLAVRFTSNLRG